MIDVRYAEPHEYPDEHLVMTVIHLGVHTYVSMGDLRAKYVKVKAKKERASISSYVYAISDGTNVKIGKSNNPHKRRDSLQTSNSKVLYVIATFNCTNQIEAFKLEKKLHSKFSKYRLNREWFSIPMELLQAEWLKLTKE